MGHCLYVRRTPESPPLFVMALSTLETTGMFHGSRVPYLFQIQRLDYDHQIIDWGGFADVYGVPV